MPGVDSAIRLPDADDNKGPSRHTRQVGTASDGSALHEELLQIDALKGTNELLYWILSELRFANGEKRLPGKFQL